MCVDATRKLLEELRVTGLEFRVDDSYRIDSKKLMSDFSEIVQVNDSLLSLGISMVFLSVQKNRKNHLKELSESLFKNSELNKVKFVIFLEANVDCSDLKDAVWRFTNNIDPRRDSFIVEQILDYKPSTITVVGENTNNGGDGISHIAFDGTRKTKEFDNFDRDWPNILAMDEKTIQLVDEKWERYGLGKFISSPSLKYRKQLYKGGAVAE